MDTPKISIIIPTYNAARTLGECLRAAFASQYPDFEVIVVDDGSRDDSAAVAAGFPCRLVRLEQERRRSAGQERRRGSKRRATSSSSPIPTA